MSKSRRPTGDRTTVYSPYTYTRVNFASPLYIRREKDNVSSPDPENAKT